MDMARKVRDSRTSRHSAHVQSQVFTKPFKNGMSLDWARGLKPEVAILGADQKERGLWEREC